MAAYLLSPPGMPWTDANGDPLNGGLIYVYQAGTSTLTDSYPTYADAVARTNPNTNPVVLNATGLGGKQLKYYCSPHKVLMHGVIVVKAGSAP